MVLISFIIIGLSKAIIRRVSGRVWASSGRRRSRKTRWWLRRWGRPRRGRLISGSLTRRRSRDPLSSICYFRGNKRPIRVFHIMLETSIRIPIVQKWWSKVKVKALIKCAINRPETLIWASSRRTSPDWPLNPSKRIYNKFQITTQISWRRLKESLSIRNQDGFWRNLRRMLQNPLKQNQYS